MSFAAGARRLAGQVALLLGWRPDDFWRATPDELADALGVLDETVNGAAAGRADIRRLMEAFPDG